MNRRALFALVPFLGLATRLKTAIRQPAKFPPRTVGAIATPEMITVAQRYPEWAVAPLVFHPQAFALVWKPIPLEHITPEQFRKRYPAARIRER